MSGWGGGEGTRSGFLDRKITEMLRRYRCDGEEEEEEEEEWKRRDDSHDLAQNHLLVIYILFCVSCFYIYIYIYIYI